VDFTRAREHLLGVIGSEIRDSSVITAMGRVPRELFVPADLKDFAYEDRPLSIGYGQTISQPYIVALMTQALELKPDDRVLEVGTGSGYQAAILCEIAGTVYTIERIPELADTARILLNKLGYVNVRVKSAGEEIGWKENAPYDAIIVTAAAPNIHRGLVEQLALNGRLVIPVGSRWDQELIKLTRIKSGSSVEKLGGCRFVPLIGRDAWDE
jgi:protein-L-isoaspartate(D-aspartate) O-methyltransferase